MTYGRSKGTGLVFWCQRGISNKNNSECNFHWVRWWNPNFFFCHTNLLAHSSGQISSNSICWGVAVRTVLVTAAVGGCWVSHRYSPHLVQLLDTDECWLALRSKACQALMQASCAGWSHFVSGNKRSNTMPASLPMGNIPLSHFIKAQLCLDATFLN